jgi:hypothetical protein
VGEPVGKLVVAAIMMVGTEVTIEMEGALLGVLEGPEKKVGGEDCMLG